jgi:hypothetical protein
MLLLLLLLLLLLCAYLLEKEEQLLRYVFRRRGLDGGCSGRGAIERRGCRCRLCCRRCFPGAGSGLERTRCFRGVLLDDRLDAVGSQPVRAQGWFEGAGGKRCIQNVFEGHNNAASIRRAELRFRHHLS